MEKFCRGGADYKRGVGGVTVETFLEWWYGMLSYMYVFESGMLLLFKCVGSVEC